jgi:hypothetical protein
MPVTNTIECTVGGEQFEFTTTGSYSIFGRRPDGKPYGSWDFPLELPECPDNGLIMFDEFSDDEKARLSTILRDPRYQTMRETESSYYRAMWLARELGRGREVQHNLLRQAIWQTDDQPEQRKRYFLEYLALVPKFAGSEMTIDQLWEEMAAVNAMREVGDFDTAKQRLSGINVSLLTTSAEDDVVETKRNFNIYRAQMMIVIDRRDSSSEPIDMVGGDQAALICGNKTPLSNFEVKYCEQSWIQDIIKSNQQ